MAVHKLNYVCAKHGRPYKYFMVGGFEIPYCTDCHERKLYKQEAFHPLKDKKVLANMSKDRRKILHEKQIWKGSQMAVVSKSAYKRQQVLNSKRKKAGNRSIMVQLNIERAKRVRSEGNK